jgi:hypothetical protein
LKLAAALASSANTYISLHTGSHVVYQTLGQSLSTSIDVLIARVMGTKSRKLAGAWLLIGLIELKVTPTLPDQIKGTIDVSHFTVPFRRYISCIRHDHYVRGCIDRLVIIMIQHVKALRRSRRARDGRT